MHFIARASSFLASSEHRKHNKKFLSDQGWGNVLTRFTKKGFIFSIVVGHILIKEAVVTTTTVQNTFGTPTLNKMRLTLSRMVLLNV